MNLQEQNFSRTHPDSGWVDPRRLPQGPHGRALCRFCGLEVPKGRRTFCSDACVTEWKIRTNPGFVAARIYDRDHGVCAGCGLDTDRAERIYRAVLRRAWEQAAGHPVFATILRPPLHDPHGPFLLKLWGISKPHQQWWEANHIKAVSEGGGLCGLEGYETLCQRCHREHTAGVRKRLAEQRRKEKSNANRQATVYQP